MPNQKNKDVVNVLAEKVTKAKSIIFADYLGISAQGANDLRRQIKENNAEVVVAKNTLLKVALDEKDPKSSELLKKDLKGSTAAVFTYGDPIPAIKILFDFGKKMEFPKVKSAIIEGVYNSAEQIEILKDLPSKEVLLARAFAGMKAPVSGFVNVLGGVQRKFVYALNAISEKKGGAK